VPADGDVAEGEGRLGQYKMENEKCKVLNLKKEDRAPGNS
jgi:hypothetical protein